MCHALRRAGPRRRLQPGCLAPGKCGSPGAGSARAPGSRDGRVLRCGCAVKVARTSQGCRALAGVVRAGAPVLSAGSVCHVATPAVPAVVSVLCDSTGPRPRAHQLGWGEALLGSPTSSPGFRPPRAGRAGVTGPAAVLAVCSDMHGAGFHCTKDDDGEQRPRPFPIHQGPPGAGPAHRPVGRFVPRPTAGGR